MTCLALHSSSEVQRDWSFLHLHTGGIPTGVGGEERKDLEGWMMKDQCDPSVRRTREEKGSGEETGAGEGAFPSGFTGSLTCLWTLPEKNQGLGWSAREAAQIDGVSGRPYPLPGFLGGWWRSEGTQPLREVVLAPHTRYAATEGEAERKGCWLRSRDRPWLQSLAHRVLCGLRQTASPLCASVPSGEWRQQHPPRRAGPSPGGRTSHECSCRTPRGSSGSCFQGGLTLF